MRICQTQRLERQKATCRLRPDAIPGSGESGCRPRRSRRATGASPNRHWVRTAPAKARPFTSGDSAGDVRVHRLLCHPLHPLGAARSDSIGGKTPGYRSKRGGPTMRRLGRACGITVFARVNAFGVLGQASKFFTRHQPPIFYVYDFKLFIQLARDLLCKRRHSDLLGEHQ